MAGLAERRGPGEDSFWTRRETMYAFAEAIDPDDLKAIATQLYVDMVKAGYTQVCEFHYRHHSRAACPMPIRGDVAGPHRSGEGSGHRPDAAAGALHDRWLRRPSLE